MKTRLADISVDTFPPTFNSRRLSVNVNQWTLISRHLVVDSQLSIVLGLSALRARSPGDASVIHL